MLHKIAHRGSAAGGSARKSSPALAMLQSQSRSKTPMMSPAARALATKLKGVGGAGGSTTSERDDVLRASYRATAGVGGGGSTPLAGRSGSRPASRASTPMLGAGSGVKGLTSASISDILAGKGITDDLLKL